MCCIYLASYTATVHTRQSRLNQVHSKETQKGTIFDDTKTSNLLYYIYQTRMQMDILRFLIFVDPIMEK